MKSLINTLKKYNDTIYHIDKSINGNGLDYYACNGLKRLRKYLNKNKYDTNDGCCHYFYIYGKNTKIIFLKLSDIMIRNDILFTYENIMTNIKTGKRSLINKMKYLYDGFTNDIDAYNNKQLLNRCINDLMSNKPRLILTDAYFKILSSDFSYQLVCVDDIFMKLRVNKVKMNHRRLLVKCVKKLYNINYSVKFSNLKIHKSKIKNNDDCCICLDKLNYDACTKFPCGHYIHYKCAVEWARSELINSCPYCRSKV
jgi:hypothetical protein